MFNLEKNGYCKAEVDQYIIDLKSQLLERNLISLDYQEKILQLKQKFIEGEGQLSLKNFLNHDVSMEKEAPLTTKIQRVKPNKPVLNGCLDDFMNVKPENSQIYKNMENHSSSFDLNEAIAPKQGLDEIMKAFDFFNTEEN